MRRKVMNRVPLTRRIQVINCLVEGNSHGTDDRDAPRHDLPRARDAQN
jgi:hypothetical protein